MTKTLSVHPVIIFDKNDEAQGYKFTKSLANYPPSLLQPNHRFADISILPSHNNQMRVHLSSETIIILLQIEKRYIFCVMSSKLNDDVRQKHLIFSKRTSKKQMIPFNSKFQKSLQKQDFLLVTEGFQSIKIDKKVFVIFDNVFHAYLMRGFQKYGRNLILTKAF